MPRIAHLPLAVLALLAGGCGGTTDEPAMALAAGPGAAPLVAAPASGAGAVALPLVEWLGRLAARDGLQVTAAPGIAQHPVTGDPPAHADAATLLAALAAFDVTLVYARRAGTPPALAALGVHPPGGLSLPAAAPAAERCAVARATPAAAPVDVDPARAMQAVRHDMASGDPAVRRAALARSFELEAPLPVPVLGTALQADASAEVRLYALMALARHPKVEAGQLRTWLQAAHHDPDPGVRAQALEVDEQLEAAEQPE